MITLISAIIAAIIGGAFTFFLHRRHEHTKEHFQEIKSVVLAHLKAKLSDYYLRILDRREGFLKVDYDTTALCVKLPAFFAASTLGEHIELRDHLSAYPHLYKDVKEYHFPDLVFRLEQLEEEFQKLANRCLEQAQELERKLEEAILLPSRTYPFQQQLWMNYPVLAVFIHDNLWDAHYGTLSLEDLQGKWGIFWNGGQPGRIQCGQGPKEDMEKCLTLVSSLIDEARPFIAPLLEDAKLLRNESNSLKDEIETLLLIRKLTGRKCRYI